MGLETACFARSPGTTRRAASRASFSKISPAKELLLARQGAWSSGKKREGAFERGRRPGEIKSSNQRRRDGSHKRRRRRRRRKKNENLVFRETTGVGWKVQSKSVDLVCRPWPIKKEGGNDRWAETHWAKHSSEAMSPCPRRAP